MNGKGVTYNKNRDYHGLYMTALGIDPDTSKVVICVYGHDNSARWKVTEAEWQIMEKTYEKQMALLRQRLSMQNRNGINNA